MPNQKCDVCQKFGELEEVQITIKKHKECDVNGAFGTTHEVVKPKLDLPIDLNLKPNPSAPYVNTELEKMIIK